MKNPLSRSALAAALLSAFALPAHAQEKSLGETVVTAAGYEQALADAPASITVITEEQLEGKYYRDVTDALQDVPGITIEGGAGGKIESTQVYMRGMGEDYVLFLIDGRPLGSSSQAYYNGFGSATQTGWLPPVSAIKRIEVIRGPMSSLYGSSALGGVINIITKKVTERWSGSVTVDGTVQEDRDAAGTEQARYYLSGPLVAERLGLTLYGSSFRRGEDDFTGGYAYKRRVDNTARLAWQLTDSQSLGFEAGIARHYNERTARTGSAGEMNNRRENFAITHAIEWGGGARTDSFVTTEKVEIENGSNESEYRGNVFNSKTVLPFESNILTVGAEYKEEETDHDASRFPGSRTVDLTRWQMAMFIEDEFFVTQDLSLTGGLRYDRNEHYGSEVIPRLYAVYKLAPEWVLKGGVSGGYKAPTLKQADDNIVEIAARGAAWDMGNKNLKPEKSTNYELGVVWTEPKGATASLMVYRTDYEDKIDKETICTSPTNAPACTYNGEVRARINQYINLDSARLEGAEAALTLPLGAVRLTAAYTYSESEITKGANKGQPLNNLPRHMLNLGADWKLNDSFSLWSKARYKGKTVEDGTSRLPAYTLVDAGMQYKMDKRFSFFGGLYNLFDKEVNTADYGKTLDGRRLYLGMTMGF